MHVTYTHTHTHTHTHLLVTLEDDCDGDVEDDEQHDENKRVIVHRSGYLRVKQSVVIRIQGLRV